MKSRIEFMAGLDTFAPGWQEIMPRVEAHRGRNLTAQEWAEEQWQEYQGNEQFREVFDTRVGTLGAPRRCSFFEAGLPEPKGEALATFEFASRQFDDMAEAERFVLRQFREFIWRQRQARKA